MRSLFLAITLAASAFLPAAASAECLTSAAAVRAAHGQQAWSTYRTINNQRCWMEGERHDRRRLSRSVAADGGLRPMVSGEIPTPRPRPVAARRDKHPHPVVAAAHVPPVAATAVAVPAVETTGAASAQATPLAWTDQFAALEDRAALLPAVITYETRPIATTVVPLRARSMSLWTGLVHLLAGVLAIIAVIGVLTFVVGMAREWWQARAVAELRKAKR